MFSPIEQLFLLLFFCSFLTARGFFFWLWSHHISVAVIARWKNPSTSIMVKLRSCYIFSMDKILIYYYRCTWSTHESSMYCCCSRGQTMRLHMDWSMGLCGRERERIPRIWTALNWREHFSSRKWWSYILDRIVRIAHDCTSYCLESRRYQSYIYHNVHATHASMPWHSLRTRARDNNNNSRLSLLSLLSLSTPLFVVADASSDVAYRYRN